MFASAWSLSTSRCASCGLLSHFDCCVTPTLRGFSCIGAGIPRTCPGAHRKKHHKGDRRKDDRAVWIHFVVLLIASARRQSRAAFSLSGADEPDALSRGAFSLSAPESSNRRRG